MIGPYWYPGMPNNPLQLNKACPDCQVASTADVCWICGGDVSENHHIQVRNPSGPLPDAVGTSLIL